MASKCCCIYSLGTEDEQSHSPSPLSSSILPTPQRPGQTRPLSGTSAPGSPEPETWRVMDAAPKPRHDGAGLCTEKSILALVLKGSPCRGRDVVVHSHQRTRGEILFVCLFWPFKHTDQQDEFLASLNFSIGYSGPTQKSPWRVISFLR